MQVAAPVMDTDIESAAMHLYNTDSYISEVVLPKEIARGTSIYAKVENSSQKSLYISLRSCFETPTKYFNFSL